MATLVSDVPSAAPVNSPDTTVTLTGTGFFPDAVATFNGTPLSTTYVSSSQLTVTIPHALLTVAGTYPIVVTTGHESFDYEVRTGPPHFGLAVPTPTGIGNTNFGIGAMTWSFWIKPLGTVSVEDPAMVIIANDGAHSYYSIEFETPGGGQHSWDRLLFTCVNQFPLSGSVVVTFNFGSLLTTGAWYHVAVSCLGASSPTTLATVSCVLNGSSISGTVSTGTLTGLELFGCSNPLCLGCNPDPGGGLTIFGNNIADSHFDEISFFQRYYNTSDVNTYLYNGGEPLDLVAESAPGLFSWWQAEGTGNDTLGNNNATLYNGLGYVADQPGSTNLPINSIPFIVTPPVSGLFTVPNQDTIQGGQPLAAYGGATYSGTTQTLLTNTLPGPWSSSSTGSGSVTATFSGLQLSSGRTASSTATVTIPSISSQRQHFDVAIDTVVTAPGAALSARCEPVSLEFTGSSGDFARVALIFDKKLNPIFPVVQMNGIASGVAISGGQVQVEASVTTLRLVRRQGLMWAFFGTRGLGGNLDSWASLTLVGSFLLRDESGTLTITCRNLTNGAQVGTLLTNFTSRGHLTFNNHLAVGKTTVSTTRLLCTTPVVGPSELGTVTITAFGEALNGLVGSDIRSSTFLYVRPPPYSIGAGLRLYTDPRLRDDS